MVWKKDCCFETALPLSYLRGCQSRKTGGGLYNVYRRDFHPVPAFSGTYTWFVLCLLALAAEEVGFEPTIPFGMLR